MGKCIGIIRKAEGTDYWIDSPDLPGCYSSGETIEAAKANFREAAALHLDGKDPPEVPSRSADQFTEEELEDAVETCIIEL